MVGTVNALLDEPLPRRKACFVAETSSEGARARVGMLAPTGNTNAPAIMIAECAAEFITGIPAGQQD
ncbi:phosphoglycerate-specific signal transduction histidine kinase [Arthrobacter sp. UYCu723]